MSELYTEAFWHKEQVALWDEVARIASYLILAGADSGIELLPQNVQPLFNITRFNQQAIDFLNSYRLNTIRGIHETTRANVFKAVQNWLEDGTQGIGTLQAQLAGTFGQTRAHQIAVTEVTRMYAEGNLMAWKAAGVVGASRWMTAGDDLVCPICGPLDGMIVPLGQNGFTTEIGGLGLTAPPAHVNCRCWLQPVVDEALFEEQIRQILELGV